MPDLTEIPDESGPVRLLLIASTKAGKSTYVAEAAISGFNVIYIDTDNGLSALRARIGKEKDFQEIYKRVHYFGVTHPRAFIMGFLRSTPLRPFFWVPRLNDKWSPNLKNLQDDDDVWCINIKAIPGNFVLSIDSWTSLSQDALEQLRPGQEAPLTQDEVDGGKQSVYGDAKSTTDYIANMLSGLPMHVIVQAHGTVFERYEKPLNMTPAEAKQKLMKLVDIIEVPIGSSRQSGLELGKRFNHIAWLETTSTGLTDIDFTRNHKRVSGGPPNRKARTTDLPFITVVKESKGPLPDSKVETDATVPWYTCVKASTLKKP